MTFAGKSQVIETLGSLFFIRVAMKKLQTGGV